MDCLALAGTPQELVPPCQPALLSALPPRGIRNKAREKTSPKHHSKMHLPVLPEQGPKAAKMQFVLQERDISMARRDLWGSCPNSRNICIGSVVSKGGWRGEGK